MDVFNISFLPKLLLLLQLFTTAPSTAEYRTVIANVAIHSPISLVADVEDECECKTKCWLDSGCTAASYDAVADICSMTDSGPDTVTTRPLLDSVAFFKFGFLETPLEVFLTYETKNGTLASQRALCAEQNGVPLIIKTQHAMDEAMRLTRENGGDVPIVGTELESWLSASHCEGGSNVRVLECRWPDGTSIFDAIFHEVSDTIPVGPVTKFQESGSVVAVDEQSPIEFPVLCSKNLN